MERALVVLERAPVPEEPLAKLGGFHPGAEVLVRVNYSKKPLKGEFPHRIDFDTMPGRVSVIIDGKMRYPSIYNVELAS